MLESLESSVRGPWVSVRVRRDGAEDPTDHTLRPGGMIGRLWSADLPIDHPSVSEAHALVSLRQGALWLLSLRRRLAVDAVVLAEVRLEPGLVVHLAGDVALEVTGLGLPSQVETLSAPGMASVVVPSVCAIHARPAPTVSGRVTPDAPAVLWTDGAGWRLRAADGERTVAPGDTFHIEDIPFTLGLRPVEDAGPGVTRVSGGVDDPLVVVASFDTVQLHRDGEPTLTLNGAMARIVSELAAFDGPVSWRTVAGEVWPEEAVVEAALRKRWDVMLARLRARLREARIRPDLIRSDGKGSVELVLKPGDRVRDNT